MLKLGRIIIALFALLLALPAGAMELRDPNPRIEIYFSPGGGCTEAIVREIRSARSEILVQAYSFTSKEIAAAVIESRRRGLRIEAVLDKSNVSARYSVARFLLNMGIPTWIDAAHAIAHNKVMIIDRETVITGSFNFTRAAEEKNAENLLIIRSRGLASVYLENFRDHKAHSLEYRGR